MTTGLRFVLLLATAGLSAPAAGGGILYYVDDDAPAGGDGLSWATAYRFPQDALAVAAASGGTIDEIRVGEGVYTPDRDEANPDGATTTCCVSHSGLGCDDSGCEAIVCGVLPLCCSEAWDEVCVTLALDLCGTLCIDSRSASFQLVSGVALRGGYAGFGAPDPDARDVDLYLTVLTGDLLGDDGPDFLNNAENSYNVVTGSGTDVTAELDGFTITAGNADGPDPGELNWIRGAGMWTFVGSPTVTNCTFDANMARRHGGGMYNHTGSNPILTNCTFSGNVTVDFDGGGMYNCCGSSPTVTNCTFSGNTANRTGGGMLNFNADATVVNCEFLDNTADPTNGGGGGMANGVSNPTVQNCVFIGNSAWLGGGMYNFQSAPNVTSCTFDANTAVAGGAVNNDESSPTISRCQFILNMTHSNGAGGAMLNATNSSPVIEDCLFSENFGSGSGGAVGTGIDSYPTLINCTIGFNTSDMTGGGVFTTDAFGGHSGTTILNSIVYGNGGIQIVNVAGAITTVEHSDVQFGHAGSGNIDADPLFVDPDNGDFRLQPGSPCIDAGDNMAVPVGITQDLDGNPRFANDLATTDTGKGECPIVDMGAYEFPASCPSDVDCDGNVGITDFLSLLAAWGTDPGGSPDIDGNGTVGITDFLLLLANWGSCP